MEELKEEEEEEEEEQKEWSVGASGEKGSVMAQKDGLLR